MKLFKNTATIRWTLIIFSCLLQLAIIWPTPDRSFALPRNGLFYLSLLLIFISTFFSKSKKQILENFFIALLTIPVATATALATVMAVGLYQGVPFSQIKGPLNITLSSILLLFTGLAAIFLPFIAATLGIQLTLNKVLKMNK